MLKSADRCAGFLLIIALLFPVCLSAQNTRNVLILYEGNANHPANQLTYEIFRRAFGSDQIFEEYIDEDRLGPSDEILEEMFRSKYAGRKIDLVIGDGLPGLRFLLGSGEKLWPGTPKVFYFVERRELPPKLPPNMTGVAMTLDFGAILDLALRLRPNTRRAFYVGGVNSWEQTWRGFAQKDFERFVGRVEITYLNNLPFAELLDRLGQLPDDSVVIYSELLRDADGHVYVPARACPLIASAANAPVYGPFEIYLGSGIVGGVFFDDKDVAEQTARLGIRVLERGAASGFPIESAKTQVVVDWRQLQRWGISEARLPPGTIIRFRIPTLWEQYKLYLLIGLMAIVAQLALIIILILEMRRRKKSDLAIKNLSGRLINATEDERKRIARELHDDVIQRLSLLSVEFNLIERDFPTAGVMSRSCLREPVKQLKEIITDVHNLSHQLHSNHLETLGLGAALDDLCQQLSNQHHVAVQLIAEDVQIPIHQDLALCFYRVAQEALTNALKYSGSARVEVSLATVDGALRMTIKDYGAGFDVSAVANGLGMATMRERLRLAGGKLLVSSSAGKGTEVTAQALLADVSRHTTTA